MTRTPNTETRTRPTDDIDPMVPLMPGDEIRTDGGRIPPRESSTTRLRGTGHATAYDRGTEEIEPMVEDIR